MLGTTPSAQGLAWGLISMRVGPLSWRIELWCGIFHKQTAIDWFAFQTNGYWLVRISKDEGMRVVLPRRVPLVGPAGLQARAERHPDAHHLTGPPLHLPPQPSTTPS